MSGELSVVDQHRFLAVSGVDEELQEAMDSIAGESFGPSNLLRVKMPSSGMTKWQVPDGVGGIELLDSIRGLLVYHQKHGVLWGSEDPKPGLMPVLRTYDLKVAEQVGPIPDNMIDALEKCRIDERHFDWEKCPFNQWGTGKGGIGKRCREQRILFILRESDLYPIVVTIQPSSLTTWRNFFLHLPTAARCPYYRCVIELSLKSSTSTGGQQYAEVVPRLVGKVSQDVGELVKKRFTDILERGLAQQIVDVAEE